MNNLWYAILIINWLSCLGVRCSNRPSEIRPNLLRGFTSNDVSTTAWSLTYATGTCAFRLCDSVLEPTGIPIWCTRGKDYQTILESHKLSRRYFVITMSIIVSLFRSIIGYDFSVLSLKIRLWYLIFWKQFIIWQCWYT